MTEADQPAEFDPLGPFLGTALRALSDEIDEARRTVSGEMDVHDGALIGQDEEGRSLYRFRVEARVPLAPETPVQLRRDTPGKPLGGTLVAAEDFSLIVELESDGGLTPGIPFGKLSADAAFVLSAERKRIETALDEPDTWAAFPRYVCGVETPPSRGRTESAAGQIGGGGTHAAEARIDPVAGDPLNPAQRRAVRRAAESPFLFVWGPPGTGKTTTLGHIVAKLVARGERVLVLAHANVAVDRALLSIADATGAPVSATEGTVVRAGVAYTDELRGRPGLLLREIAAARHPDIAAELAELSARRAAIVRDLLARGGASGNRDLSAIRLRERDLREKLAEEEGRILGEAGVIATTAARASLDGRIFGQRFDAVIVDEASVMGLTSAMLAAGLASQRVLFLGDFRQLPPVVLAETDAAKKMLVRDAFAASGAQAAVERGGTDAPVALLDTQYRMTSPIAGVVNETAYDNRLRTHRTDLGDRSGPWAGHSLVVIDTSHLGGRVLRDHGADGRSSSRMNPLQAVVTAAIAAALATEAEPTAVMSPYRAQTRLLASLCADPHDMAAPLVATVHRFQGGEAERVVIDLVDGAPMQRPSPLTGGDDDLTRRLLNVAMSRARDRLVMVANLAFFERTLPSSSPTRRALDALARAGHVVSASPQTLDGPSGPFLTWHASGVEAFEQLVATSRAPVDLNLPEAVDRATLRRLVAAVGSARAGARVHTDLATAEAFEDGPAALFLDVRHGGTFAASGERLILCVGDVTETAVEVRGERAVRGLRRAFGVESGRSSPMM
jgi:hypothetical protein